MVGLLHSELFRTYGVDTVGSPHTAPSSEAGKSVGQDDGARGAYTALIRREGIVHLSYLFSLAVILTIKLSIGAIHSTFTKKLRAKVRKSAQLKRLPSEKARESHQWISS